MAGRCERARTAWAARHGRADAVRELAAQGAPLDWAHPDDGRTPLVMPPRLLPNTVYSSRMNTKTGMNDKWALSADAASVCAAAQSYGAKPCSMKK